MKIFVITILSLHLILVQALERCQTSVCSISNNCRCSSNVSPLPLAQTPQLIALTFDEAVVSTVYQELWHPLLFNRKNPDGNPISATFFVPHEYTDYSFVNELYLNNFEIGVNSITKNPLASYWAHASEETLRQEFEGQRILMSHFANIPIEDIIGARAPQLQIEGDTLINAYVDSGVVYDNSWTSRSTDPLYPYTLDYQSTQECRTDTTCPTQAHPGFWILPINNIEGNATVECNALTNCNYYGTSDEIEAWLLGQVQIQRTSTRAPLTLIVPSAWFRFIPNSYSGFEKFLDSLRRFDDIFLVSQKQVIDWLKNPVPIEEFRTEVPYRSADCYKLPCTLTNVNGEIRYMESCVPCPQVYPWLGNPLGQL